MSDAVTEHERAPLTRAPSCPECDGRMWDNRRSKRNSKAPDFKCRDRTCRGALWPGQHNAAMPIIAKKPQDATQMEEQAEKGSTQKAMVTPDNNSTLRESYLALTAFVLAEVRPRYQQAGMICGDTTVAAIAATLFIASSRREGIPS
jgi:hypothetical protein